MQAAFRQLLQDELVRTSLAARRVDVFDAHQPLAVMGSRIQPTRQCCYQRAGVQWSGW